MLVSLINATSTSTSTSTSTVPCPPLPVRRQKFGPDETFEAKNVVFAVHLQLLKEYHGVLRKESSHPKKKKKKKQTQKVRVDRSRATEASRVRKGDKSSIVNKPSGYQRHGSRRAATSPVPRHLPEQQNVGVRDRRGFSHSRWQPANQQIHKKMGERGGAKHESQASYIGGGGGFSPKQRILIFSTGHCYCSTLNAAERS